MNNKENLKMKPVKTAEQLRARKIVYICLGVCIATLILAVILGVFGLVGYKYTYDQEQQFVTQPSLVFYDFTNNRLIEPSETMHQGQVVWVYIQPLITNSTTRYALAFVAIISLVSSFILAFVAFFYFLSSVNIPSKKKDKYDDGAKLMDAKQSNLIR